MNAVQFHNILRIHLTHLEGVLQKDTKKNYGCEQIESFKLKFKKKLIFKIGESRNFGDT